jgi:hypothetical protein
MSKYTSRGRLFCLHDPHLDDRACRNLSEDFLFYCERNSEVIALASKIRDITERDLEAVISCEVLGNLNLQLGMESDIYLFNLSEDCHWISIVLCVMSHTGCIFQDDSVIFEKSEIDHPAWIHSKIRYQNDMRGWLQKVFYETEEWISTVDYTSGKVTYREIKTIRSSGNGQDNKTDGTSRRRIANRDKPQQDCLFDLY